MTEINLAPPTQFQIRLSESGTNSCHGSYPEFKDKNALLISVKTINAFTKDFAGKESMPTLQYHIACALLHQLDFPKDKLLEDIEKAKEFIPLWDIQKLD